MQLVCVCMVLSFFLSGSFIGAMSISDQKATKRARKEKNNDPLETAKEKLVALVSQNEPIKLAVKTACFNKKNRFEIGEIVLIPFQTKENEEYSYAYVSKEPQLSADDAGPYGKEWLIRTEFYADDVFAGCVVPVRSLGKLSANDELCND